jgi:ribose 5-phosphate isomerase A
MVRAAGSSVLSGGGATSHGPLGPDLQAAAARALDLVVDGDKVGLGTGRAAAAFIAALGESIRATGLAVVGVATSETTARQARAAGVPLVELDEARELALTVDGADEVAPNLDLIKGRGGALVRERIVAAASRRQVIVVGRNKLVGALGERGGVPVEIIPMARGLVADRLEALGLQPVLRQTTGALPFVTDNGNLILDVGLEVPMRDPRAARALAGSLRQIPGVVDTGLFLGTAERVLVGYPDGQVDVRLASAASGT